MIGVRAGRETGSARSLASTEIRTKTNRAARAASIVLIANLDAEPLEGILDSQRVIERTNEAGSESVTISNDGLD
jgi:hypothetical protein